MPRNHSTEFPPGYTQARQRCPLRLLDIFDGELNKYPDMDWRPSDTPLGGLYLISSILLAGMPSLILAAGGYINRDARARLYGSLIQIAECPERLNIANSATSYDALESNFLSFEHLAECPVESLHAIFAPDFYHYLKDQTRTIQAQQRGISTTLSHLRAQKDAGRYGGGGVALEREIHELEERQRRCRTFMEEFSGDGYARPRLERVQRAFTEAQNVANEAARQRYMQQWQGALTAVERLIPQMTYRITVMNNQNVNQQYETLINTATELRDTLQNAKEDFARHVENPSRNQRERTAAAERFVSRCQIAVLQATPVLEKDKTYDWRYLLADIANALTFIASLSLSYVVTGKFRLFTPVSQAESNAAEILHESERALTQIRQGHAG